MKTLRKIIEIDEERCDGCGLCAIGCAEGALEIIDGKAKVISDNLCDGLGACIGECPAGALRIIERESEDFDEGAVEKHLATTQSSQPDHGSSCGCPSKVMESFDAKTALPDAPQSLGPVESALGHWPVKIRLISPTAPFLKGADLLIMADCVSVAHPSIHSHFLKGKTVMTGCPKFDDADEHVQKFADIFSTAGIKSVTCAVMEVPCCSSLPGIVKKGMEKAGKNIPFKEVIIGRRGDIVAAPVLKSAGLTPLGAKME